MGSLVEALIAFRTAYDDSAGVEIVVESLALTEKFRCKNDIVTAVFLSDILRIAHRNRALDHHDGVWIHLHHQFDDFLNMGRVEVIFYRVVICWSCNDDEVCVFIGFCCIGLAFSWSGFSAKYLSIYSS